MEGEVDGMRLGDPSRERWAFMSCQVSGLMDIVDHTINRLITTRCDYQHPSLSPVADIVRRARYRSLEDKAVGVWTSLQERGSACTELADDFRALC